MNTQYKHQPENIVPPAITFSLYALVHSGDFPAKPSMKCYKVLNTYRLFEVGTKRSTRTTELSEQQPLYTAAAV